MTHRNDSLTKDLNGLINYADTLYLEDEGEKIIEALFIFDQYPNHTTYNHIGEKIEPKHLLELLYDLSQAVIFEPFKRLAGSLKRKILVEALNRYVVNRFMPYEVIMIPEEVRRYINGSQSSLNNTNVLELIQSMVVNETILHQNKSRRMNLKNNKPNIRNQDIKSLKLGKLS